MELKFYERIALILHYLLLASGYIGIFLWVLVKYEKGEILACILACVCVRFWFYIHGILGKKKSIEFREKHETYCNSCKYKQENDK